MKKLLLIKLGLFILLSGFTTNTHADDNLVFPTDNAIWSTYFFSSEPTRHFIYGLTGDTIINEKQYSKLYLLNDSTLNIDENDIYVAGIRQENKMVYLQPTANKFGTIYEEYLLYDFNKKKGDIVAYQRNYSSESDCHFTFENVPTISEYENIRIIDEEETEFGRKITLDIGEEWIENIGSLSGILFGPIIHILGGPFDRPQYGGILGCMKQDGKIVYMNEEYCDSCFGELWYDPNVSVENEKAGIFKTYYNKFNKSIEIQISEYPVNFELISAEGKCITTRILNDLNSNVDVSGLLKGVYIYKLSGENIHQTGKLIIN